MSNNPAKGNSPDQSLIEAAVAHYSSREYANALSLIQKLLLDFPDHPDALNIAAACCMATGQLHQAEQYWLHAVQCDPGFADVHFNLGNLYRQTLRLNEAEASYQKAISVQPTHALAHYNLARMLQDAKRLQEAEAAYLNALEANPNYVEAHNNLGVLLHETGRLPEAIASYRHALRLKPDHGHALGKVVHLSLQNCQWETLDTDIQAIREMLARGLPCECTPFEALSIPGLSAQEHKAAGHQYAQFKYAPFLQHPPLVSPDTRYSHDRLRVGYLSADFHNHATVQLMAGVLEHHDRSKIAVFAYSYGPDKQDEGRQRVKAACENFQDLRQLAPLQAAQAIMRDEIDILVDLKGYAQDSRLEITALRPAPIIVSWLGYPGTLGHPRLADYIIGDPIENAAAFSETLALMPYCYQPNDNNRQLGNPTSREEQGLAKDKFVFCSFNQTYKISPLIFSVWCRLLKEVPDSVLWLLAPSAPSSINNLRKEALLQGVDPERLIFALPKPFDEHLARLQLADLALDTFPYTSHTTGSDALWAGVPLVTCCGETFVSRVAASLLTSAGLPECITNNFEEYYCLAKKIACNPQTLHELRSKLMAQRHSTPLFNTEQFCTNLERLYLKMRQGHISKVRQPLQINGA